MVGFLDEGLLEQYKTFLPNLQTVSVVGFLDEGLLVIQLSIKSIITSGFSGWIFR
ncbi:Uncharacterised protein [Legionella pneumophila]|nr:Uncharacterised protein [Legionella pneumophila]